MTTVAPRVAAGGSAGSTRALKRAAGVLVQWAFSLVVGYAIWRWLVTPHFNSVVVAGIGPIWDSFKESASSGQLWSETRVTLYEMLAGFGVGTVIGVVLALAIALLPRLIGKAIEPLIVIIYAAPKFVLVPIMFVRFGAGFSSRFYLVTLAVFPVIAIYMLTGLRTVDPDTTDVMRMYGANRRQIGLKLMLPHAASYLTTAIVYVIPHALSMAIGAEILFATRDGLGGDMYEQSQLFNASGIYATLAVATALAVLLVFVTKRLEAWVSPDWKRR